MTNSISAHKPTRLTIVDGQKPPMATELYRLGLSYVNDTREVDLDEVFGGVAATAI